MSPPSAFACRFLAVAALLGLASIPLPPASAEELVTLDAAAPIQGYLTKPDGRGPFPAVVLLHTCLGLPANRQSIADDFARWGYAALFVDDFAGRGLKETCAVDFGEAVADAYAALAYLSKRPFVDRKRIAVVGWSQGGDTALKIASSRLAVPSGAKFKAAAAFYPPCDNLGDARLTMPTLILIGEADDVTPAADCRRLAKAQPGDGADVRLVVYPAAAHGFDNPEFAGGVRVYGMSLRYDRDAAERAKSELRDFLAKRLAR
jgi:dienelactone hydrolase